MFSEVSNQLIIFLSLLNMSDSPVIQTYDVTEVITNADEVIDNDDEDFQAVLKSIVQMSDDRDDTSKVNYSNCKINNESEESASKHSMEHLDKHKNHTTKSNPLNNGYHYLQTSKGSVISCKNMKNRHREMFPVKVYKLLEQSEIDGYSSIVSWLPNGNGFMIHNKKLFERRVLKKYKFRSTFQSFKRQLYAYGFKKIGKRFNDSGAYFHGKFIRGQKDLSSKIMK